ncbi:hypothetical protein Bbelb_380960 [Branchiostoma belcheri]|nr:hypothetical protein Bbelb_380960 [Branchiostoma belcheri]
MIFYRKGSKLCTHRIFKHNRNYYNSLHPHELIPVTLAASVYICPALCLLEDEDYEIEIDIDEMLELQTEEERVEFLKELLVDCKKPTDEFIQELLQRVQKLQKLSGNSAR